MPTASCEVRLSFPGEKSTVGQARLTEWSLFERIQRGVLGLALLWLGAGLALPIPAVHLFLVPGLLLAGPVFGVFRFTELRRLDALRGSCPRCKSERDFELRIRFNGKRTFTCDGCGNLIALEPTASPKSA